MTAIKDVGYFMLAGVSSLNPAVGQTVCFDTEIQKFRVYSQDGWITLDLGVEEIISLLTYADFGSDCLVSGAIGTPPVNSLILTSPVGRAYMAGLRVLVPADTFQYPINSDTYCFLQNNGSVVHIAVATAADPPSHAGLCFQQVVTDGSKITSVNPVSGYFGQWKVNSLTNDNNSALSFGQAYAMAANRWLADGDDFVQYGMGSPVPGSGLTTSTTDGIVWVDGFDFFVAAQSFTYPVNKDTYDFISNDDYLVKHVSVAVDADPPTSTGVLFQRVRTNGTDITEIEYIGSNRPHWKVAPAVDSEDAVPLAQINAFFNNPPQFHVIDVAAGVDLASATDYKFWVPFFRAGSLSGVSLIANAAPSAGSTLRVQSVDDSGDDCLTAGSFDATTITAKEISAVALSTVPADLAVTETQGFFVTYHTGASYPTGPVAIRLEFAPAA